jgi:hypothetical protein
MSDPRNVAHAKKVKQEKAAAGAKSKASGKATRADETAGASATSMQPEVAKPEQAPGDLQKSAAVLSKLKEMEFHSRANIETLAELTLTIEEELKQKEFSEQIGDVYSAQDNFHTKIAALIENYQTKYDSLK